jgi:hypothetical protein
MEDGYCRCQPNQPLLHVDNNMVLCLHILVEVYGWSIESDWYDEC